MYCVYSHSGENRDAIVQLSSVFL